MLVYHPNTRRTLKKSSTIPESEAIENQPLWRRILGWPSTKLGWWSILLIAIYEIILLLNNSIYLNLPDGVSWRETLLPVYGIIMMIIGLAAGIVGLIAVARRHERSLLVWITIVIGLYSLLFLIGDFLLPQ
jgi:hypothetical protein